MGCLIQLTTTNSYRVVSIQSIKSISDSITISDLKGLINASKQETITKMKLFV